VPKKEGYNILEIINEYPDSKLTINKHDILYYKLLDIRDGKIDYNNDITKDMLSDTTVNVGDYGNKNIYADIESNKIFIDFKDSDTFRDFFDMNGDDMYWVNVATDMIDGNSYSSILLDRLYDEHSDSHLYEGIIDDNIKNLLLKIAEMIGDSESYFLLLGGNFSKTTIDEFIKRVTKIDTKLGRYFSDIDDNIITNIESSGAESIINNFEKLFDPFTVNIHRNGEFSLSISIDGMLDFIIKHPTVTKFWEIRTVIRLDNISPIEDSIYNYKLDLEDILPHMKSKLDDLIWDIENSDWYEEIKGDGNYLFIGDIIDLLKKLGFEKHPMRKYKFVKTKNDYKFTIDLDTYDFKTGIIDLNVKDIGHNNKESNYRVHYNEIPEYVNNYKLYLGDAYGHT